MSEPLLPTPLRTLGPALPELCVVIPFNNEAAVLPQLIVRLCAVLDREALQATVLMVDDGSTDGSAELVELAARADSRIGVLRLSRNVGKEAALTAGLDYAEAQAVILMDADLQDPPELIPDMLAAWRSGYDVVLMRRAHRLGESLFKRASAALYYRLLRRISDVPIPEDVGDFRLLSRRAVLALRGLQERNRYMKGLLAWLGLPSVQLTFTRPPRAAGQTRWPLAKLLRLAVDGITSFSIAPLRLASLAGGLCAGLALAAAVVELLRTLLYGNPVAGFPTLIVTLLFMGGIQLLALGIVGEYVGRIYMEVKGRPLYLVDRFRPPAAETAARSEQRQP